MRELMECKAEVLRRSEKRIEERKKIRRRIISACIPLCLLLSVCSIIALPQIMTNKTDGNTNGHNPPTASNGGYYEAGKDDGKNSSGGMLENTSNFKISYINADWPYYNTVNSLDDKATNIFEGRITNIYFDIVNIKTGESASKNDKTSDIQLYTIYEVEVSSSYKGQNAGKAHIKVMGGFPGYKESDQFAKMSEYGLYKESTGIPVLSSFRTLTIGNSYLFFTSAGNGPYQLIVNPTQFAYNINGTDKTDSFGYNELKAYLTGEKTINLLAGITPNNVRDNYITSSQNAAVTDFALRLFHASEQSGKNTLISPLSVLCALSMTANGAEEETLREMEEVLGMTVEELNLYLYTYMKNLPEEEKYKLSLANSIWFTEDESFTVSYKFLQTVADYYEADLYKAPFNDETLDEINNWVKEKTDGMIPKVLDEISPETVMYLINALAFEAEWSDVYCEFQVQDGIFTREDGTEQDAEFMYSSESTYLEDENATGFIKYYKGGKYAFVALLPNENMSVFEYIATLDGVSLYELLSNSQNVDVKASIPKFECEYGVEMSGILKSMGMNEAFDANNADFDGLGASGGGNLYISRVLHKTFISVGELGTKAGAVTVVDMPEGCAPGEPEEPKKVYLDRPFVYMLIDCENNIPFFIGTMTDIEK